VGGKAANRTSPPYQLIHIVMSSGAQRSRDISIRHNIPLRRVKGKHPNRSDNLNCTLQKRAAKFTESIQAVFSVNFF
jgi:hypothetical protein